MIYRNDDPPDETEDPTTDYIVDLMTNGIAFDRETIRAGFMLRFQNDFQPEYIEKAFEQAYITAIKIFDELYPDESDYPHIDPDESDDGPFAGPDPWDYFQANPDRRDE